MQSKTGTCLARRGEAGGWEAGALHGLERVAEGEGGVKGPGEVIWGPGFLWRGVSLAGAAGQCWDLSAVAWDLFF